jgi:hypothetical protein
LIEWELVLVPMLAAQVVWRLAIKRTVLWVLAVLVVLMLAIKQMVLAMLWVLVLAIQRMVVLGLVKLPLYRKQILRSRQEWFAFLGTHVNAPMISLNSRLYSHTNFSKIMQQ